MIQSPMRAAPMTRRTASDWRSAQSRSVCAFAAVEQLPQCQPYQTRHQRRMFGVMVSYLFRAQTRSGRYFLDSS